jgi:Mrp family chromosome partitioning ATPase
MSAPSSEKDASFTAPGTLPSAHTLYQDLSSRHRWTTEPPKDIGPSVQNATSAQYALVARCRPNSDNPCKDFDLDITVVFEALVAPPEQKELILAFAEAQAKNRTGFDDVIRDKGKGLIMLLSGPPGVGKTLTAESVAETMRVPLYEIGAAELGSRSTDIETALGKVLDLCTKWNAGTFSSSTL